MLARTHIALGVLFAIGLTFLFGMTYFDGGLDLIAILVVIIGALLPDLDMGTSSLAGKFAVLKVSQIEKIWLITILLLAIVTTIFFRSTPIFYGIIFMLLLGALFSKEFSNKGYHMLRNFVQGIVGIGFIAAAYYYNQLPLMGIGVVLLLLLFSKHRGLSHSILFVIITVSIVSSISRFYGAVDYGILFGVSVASHIMGDMFTKAGVLLFYPFSKKRVRFLFTIKTGGKLENIVFFITCILVFRLTRLL
ncbi:MAG: metal-dependent hydrolase [Clostridiaceae bacterium]|nr:metal-dependent hydrolase [Clostridiaceae bacterium]